MKQLNIRSSRERRRKRQVALGQNEKPRLNPEKGVLPASLKAPEPCTGCQQLHTGTCPGVDLCGKTVLYVGGHHKMITRYKQVVENYGGNFLHHDGGREKSMHVLANMLGCADAVFCPVDCISHEACKRVKKICKQQRKPFVIMRSSGISSLSRSIRLFMN